MEGALVRKPGAWIPIAMSLLALALVLGHLAVYGKDPQPDEGTAAHLFHVLMVGQLPVIVFFALRWWPRRRKETIGVLALQLAAGIAAFVPVAVLGW